jgi:hypothetical protein
MLVHLCESSMFQHYLTYFMGAYPPATDMRTLPIVRKYVTPANVLANFKYYNRYVATYAAILYWSQSAVIRAGCSEEVACPAPLRIINNTEYVSSM